MSDTVPEPFGPTLLDLPREETDVRLDQVRAALAGEGMAGLLAYADAWRASNIGVFSDFRPLDGVGQYAQALLLIPVESAPTLYVADGA